jgi:hypothetical protein
MKKNNIFTQIY